MTKATHILLVDDEALARNELNYLLTTHREDLEIHEASSIKEALNCLISQKIDLIFLDMQLQDEQGVELLDSLSHLNQKPLVIFATAFDDYAVKAFEVQAQDYLLKPFEDERVAQVLDRALAELAKSPRKVSPKPLPSSKRVSLPIQGDDRIHVLNFAEMVVLEARQGLVEIHTPNQVFTTQKTLKDLESQLPADDFIRTHRSFILNRNHIKEIQPWFNRTYQVTLTGNIKVPVSRSYLDDFRHKIGI